MLQNRLAVIMAERGIKAINISKKTGIATSTLSKISNNQTTKIDYETIDSICIAIGITPEEFFEFIPFNFEISVDKTHFKLDYVTNELFDFVKIKDFEFEFDLLISASGKEIEEFNGEGAFTQSPFNGEYHSEIKIDSSKERDRLNNLISELPHSFLRSFNRKLLDSINSELINAFEKWKKDANWNVEVVENHLDEFINNLDFYISIPFE